MIAAISATSDAREAMEEKTVIDVSSCIEVLAWHRWRNCAWHGPTAMGRKAQILGKLLVQGPTGTGVVLYQRSARGLVWPCGLRRMTA
jgi:hypothetical protein